jgi:hypothetical protein
MSTVEKYRVALRCRPEEGSTFEPPSGDGVCTVLYSVYAANREEALEHAFAAHVHHCDKPCGNCEVTAEAEMDRDNVLD